MNEQEIEGLETAIAVVGMSGRFPGSRDLKGFWRNLREGVESFSPLTDAELEASGVDPELIRHPDYVKVAPTLQDMEMFDAGFFGFSPRDASIMDPQQRHFLELSWEALEDAGYTPEGIRGAVGVFASSGTNAYLWQNLMSNPDLARDVGFFLLRHTGNDKDFLSTRVSYLLNLTGPSVNVQTACSSSLVGIHLATQSLLNGECDVALAGGVTIKQPHHIGYLYQEGEILSNDGHCRSFDADSLGTVFGSGAGVVVLKRAQEALEAGDHIYALVRGSAVNNDGARKVGFLAPSVDGQASAVAEALAVSGVEPETIGFLEAHGTGTPVGDPIEVTALTEAFRANGAEGNGFCVLGSVKTNIGHLDTASGVASFIKASLALHNGEIPATLHFRTPNPAVDFASSPFRVSAERTAWPRGAAPRRAAINSLGAGGTNAHVILEEAPVRGPAAPPKRPWELLALSGRSTSVVERASARLGSHLDTVEPADFPDVAYTLQVGRRAFKQRRIVAVRGPSDAVDTLAAGDTKRVFTGTAPDRERSAAFLFAGGGAQYPHMGRELYDTEPVYREVVDRCLGLLRGQLDVDLRTLLYPAAGDEAAAAEELQRPSRALPALFTTQYAQARLWMSWGITPTAMIGHSMGEYTAACLSGVLSVEDALSIVTIRGKLFETLPEGAMISVPLPAEELRTILPPELSLAAINAPELSLAAGPVAAIEAFQAVLREREVEGQRLHINVAAHSSMLDPILAPFREALGKIRFGKPEIPFVSNLSGTWITPEEAADPDYWVRHLRNTVDFAGGVAELLGSTDRVLLEVGPGRVLSTLARLHSARTNDHEVLSSMRHPGEEGSDVAFQLTTLGRLWIAGVPVDWESFQGEGRRRVPLPTYPFEHQPYWIEPGRKAVAGAESGPVDGSRKSDLADWFWQPSWRRTSPVPALSDRMDGEHVLVWGDAHGPATALEEALGRRGADVISVRPGEAFEAHPDGSYTVHPGREEEIDHLFETLGAAGRVPGSIIHTLAATTPAPGADLSGVAEAEDRAFHSLLGLARAVARAGWDGALRLSVLTRGAHQLASEAGGDPLQSLVTGPVAVIAREFPGVRTRVVDLAPGVTLTAGGRGADRITSELLAPGADQVVAIRGRDRWVRTFEPLRLPEAGQVAPRVREGSTWLITGGLGGLGLVFAGELSSVRGVRLVLAGRTGLPSRNGWDAWIQAHGREDRTAQAIEAIRDLEARGAQVVPAAVDITDLTAVRTLVREVSERFGPLQGVIHAAGVVEDALILNKERDSAARVLAPKVRGTLALEAALRDHPPEVMVLFSSRGAVTGVAGQIDYASASAFLDAWARTRTTDDPDGPTIVSIDWSPWKEVGLAYELAREQMGDSRPRPRPVAHPLLDGVVEEEDTEVFSGLFPRGRHWMLDEHQIRGAHALIPGTGYLELARAAFTQQPGPGALLLRDLYFLEPFIVPEGSARALRIRLTRKGNTGRFSIQGAPADQARSEDARWQEHARGVAEWIDEAPPAPLDLEAIRTRCSQRVVEGVQEKPHLQLGARWSSLQSMRFGAREALLEQELPAAFLGDLEEFHLHPALLDTATAGAQSLIEGFDEDRDFYVPGSYTRLVQYSPVPARIRSHIRWRPNPDGDNQFAVFDVTVTDESGAVVLEASEFVMVRVDDRSRMVVEEILGEAPPARAEPVSAGAMPADEELPPMLREAIRTSEGIDLFRRVLAAEAPPQVIVSPHDLRAVLEGLDAPPTTPVRKVRSAPALDVTPVEALLTEHPAVKEAVVQVYQDRPGEQRLVAYVVYDPMERATVSELRRYLREGVDETLVPQNFLEMDSLPRAEDGSVARAALEDPFAPVDDHVEPRTATEAVVANIWMDLLGADRVSVHDNFLDVGGHSLLAMRALLKIEKETGVRLNPSVMNMHTLEQIAAEIDETRGGGSGGPDEPGPDPDPQPDPEPEEAQGLRRFLSDLVRG